MTRYWQDLLLGECFSTGTLTLTQDNIQAFARQFDPQPYHMDSAVAESSIFGGLCASGWQVAALMMRLITDTLQDQKIQTLGIASVPNMQWRRPVFVGDTLSAVFTVIDRAAESRQPNSGSLDLEVTVNNQNDKPVINLTARVLIPHGEITHAG